MRRAPKLGPPPSRRREPPSHPEFARAVMEAHGYDPATDRVLVVGARQGTVEHVPPGYALAPCCECGRMTWLASEWLLSFKVVAACSICAQGSS